ncbi:MinD/ParA family protein [Bacillus testis]|uniref:MinD/ParA family protein n=1 Tax=Bacillus testis TaxID=1622072 RepID=UPI00067E9DDD|nr:MinD/ParA family protein [Bacillus testis]
MRNDQAEGLRRWIGQANGQKNGKTIAVISGKGGVGKSNFSLNFSIQLSLLGKKVLLFDMDIGMGNIDILLGNTAERNIVDFFAKGLSFDDIITDGPGNLQFISGGSGLAQLFSMNDEELGLFLGEFAAIQDRYDYIFFDLGAGISAETAKFLQCVDEIITITTPEPTSIMDAYSIVKYLHMKNEHLPIKLLCNRAETERQGRETIKRLQTTLRRFLGKELAALGSLPDSKYVKKAVIRQMPFTILYPYSDITRAMQQLAAGFVSGTAEEPIRQPTAFLDKFKHFFIGR